MTVTWCCLARSMSLEPAGLGGHQRDVLGVVLRLVLPERDPIHLLITDRTRTARLAVDDHPVGLIFAEHGVE